jgi:glucokinase
MSKYAIGTDIGGSHISCAAIDLDKEIIIHESFSTLEVDNHAFSEVILNTWATALNESIQKMGKNQLAGIGFAMPGPFDYEHGIALFKGRNDKFEDLYGINIIDSIKKKLVLGNDLPVRFMNDATSFAIGEVWLGKAAGLDRVLAITLGTGFGSAFVDKGIPVVDREDVPPMGCVWHLPYKNGIADGYFSTRWFIKRYEEKSGVLASGVKEIAENSNWDPLAMDVIKEFGENLGEFLAPWLMKFKTDGLIIGGNISGAYDKFGPFFEDALKRHHINASVYISELKEHAALAGSAKLVNEDFWRNVKPLLSKM